MPADPEFRAAIIGYLEWGTRLAMENSQPGAKTRRTHPRPAGAGGSRRRTRDDRPARPSPHVKIAAVRILNIDVPEDLARQWASWFSPPVQPFLVDDELADLVDGTEHELSDEVRDTFCLYGPPDGLRHVWLDEQTLLGPAAVEPRTPGPRAAAPTSGRSCRA